MENMQFRWKTFLISQLILLCFLITLYCINLSHISEYRPIKGTLILHVANDSLKIKGKFSYDSVISEIAVARIFFMESNQRSYFAWMLLTH